MMVELRTVSRVLEYFHLPLQHSPDVLRDVYLEVSGSCDFDNFIRIPGGARLESAAAENSARSTVSFLKDRITFQEEQSTTSLEVLVRRIEATLAVAVEKCGIPLFVARNITYRAVCPTPGGLHASAFLQQNFFNLTPSHFEGFERPGALVGFRMQFPPKNPTQEPLHQVRIEAYLKDPRSLFVEDWATFKVPVQSRELGRLSTEAREVEEFLGQKLGGFIGQFGGEANS